MFLLTPPSRECPGGARPFRTEKDLLSALLLARARTGPRVLTGWNGVDFDLFVLDRVDGPRGVPLELGRGPGTLRLRADGAARGTRQATIPGRVVLDGIHPLRGAFVRMDDYGLDAVARSVLGEVKALAGHDRAEEIVRLFEEDRERLVEYDRTDARLPSRCSSGSASSSSRSSAAASTGLPLGRVASSIAAFDFLYPPSSGGGASWPRASEARTRASSAPSRSTR